MARNSWYWSSLIRGRYQCPRDHRRYASIRSKPVGGGDRQWQLENRDGLSLAPSVTDRNDFSPHGDVDLLDSHRRSQHGFERNREVLLDGRVESDGLLGLVVRIDDGFLDHAVETCRRNPEAARRRSGPAVWGVVFRHVYSFELLGAELRRHWKHGGFRVYFRADRPVGSSGTAGRQALRVNQMCVQGTDSERSLKERAPSLTGRIGRRKPASASVKSRLWSSAGSRRRCMHARRPTRRRHLRQSPDGRRRRR